IVEGQSVLFMDARVNGKTRKHPPVYLIDGKLYWNAEYETLQLNFDIENIPMDDIASIQVNAPSLASQDYLSPQVDGKFEPFDTENNDEEEDISERFRVIANANTEIARRVLKNSGVKRMTMQNEVEVTVVNIVTKSKTYSSELSRGLSVHKIYGYATPKEFYQPDYSVKQVVQSQPDTRPTLYWNPQVLTDKNGKAQVSFFNSDNNPPMEVIIQGTDRQGRFGVQRLRLNEE
ncbi:MAG: hypothetical protein AB8G22_21205, partial [Saprospiraceae bacterium]